MNIFRNIGEDHFLYIANFSHSLIVSNNHSADNIFWSLGIIEFIFSRFDNRVPLKPVLGIVAGVAHFITGHGQTQ